MNRHLLFFIILLVVSGCTNTETIEINNKKLHEISRNYDIEIIYEIDEILATAIARGNTFYFRNNIFELMDPDVVARYPEILAKALGRYPPEVINEHLDTIILAGNIQRGGLKALGTYDLFRRSIYLVNDGTLNDKVAVETFHHEFSSLLLWLHDFDINSWKKYNPKEFVYKNERYIQWQDIFFNTPKRKNPEYYYEKGFLNRYCTTNYENDVNEYAAMIFTYPDQFSEIAAQYPRIAGKFRVFQAFYRKIDPVFTEEYLLGKN